MRVVAMQTASVYSVDRICGYHIESKTKTLACPACRRLIVIEWPAILDKSHDLEQIEPSVAA
jgi:hypothetical protein